MRFRQFLLRDLAGVQGEWKLVTMAWNIKEWRRWRDKRAQSRAFTIRPRRLALNSPLHSLTRINIAQIINSSPTGC